MRVFIAFNIDYEVVPGISALLSALAYSGIPLTHRDYNRGFLVVAGYRRDCEGSDDCLLRIADNINYGLRNELVIVLYMALRNWENFSERIERKDAPVALIESGAYPGQRVFSTVVGNVRKVIDSEKLKSPTLIVIGENVKVREHLNWWESQALHGMRILSFSSELLSAELEEMVGALGGFIRSMELYELKASELEAVSGYLRALKSYDYLVITSRNAFEIFMRDLKLLEIDVRDIPKVIVTGEKTSQEFKALGIYPDIVPRVFSADGIIESLSELDITGKRFLFP
ncbi:MAG: uroporphyrinogen-III synthase, partial [Spirochaetota bacterium]|nr:uroporphyrinogen-III synthase [Spirochaetota bacterium]